MDAPKLVSNEEVHCRVETISKPLLSLDLVTRRNIRAKHFHVAMTYSGLLAGWPVAEFLQGDLDVLPQRYRAIFGEFPVHVLSPNIERIETKSPMSMPGTMQLAFLPKVEIAAFFFSYPPVKNQEMHFSGLIVVWHQDSWEQIPTEESKRKLAEINWDSLARDFEI